MGSCLNSRGEVPWRTCCGDRTFNWVAMLYGGLALLAFIFAVASTATSNWTTFTTDADDYFFFNEDHYFGLWAIIRSYSDDDDYYEVNHIKGNDDRLLHRSTFQLNRATTLITLSLSLCATVYYMVSACVGRCKPMEVVVGTIFILLFLLSLSGSSVWVDKFDDKYFVDDNEFIKDKVICGQGCALQFFNAFFCLFVGVGMLFFATRNCFCFPHDYSDVIARTEESMMA